MRFTLSIETEFPASGFRSHPAERDEHCLATFAFVHRRPDRRRIANGTAGLALIKQTLSANRKASCGESLLRSC
jgi:hypothetical protein